MKHKYNETITETKAVFMYRNALRKYVNHEEAKDRRSELEKELEAIESVCTNLKKLNYWYGKTKGNSYYIVFDENGIVEEYRSIKLMSYDLGLSYKSTLGIIYKGVRKHGYAIEKHEEKE